MKKLFFIGFMIVFVFAETAFATTALYRISSGEVYAISTTDDPFTENAKGIYFEVITNATYQDGTQCMTISGYNLRVLGTAKILDGTVIRNATQSEIDAFIIAEADDYNKIAADAAIQYLKTNPQFRRIMIAFAATLIEYEFNKYRTWFTNFQTEVAALTSLADFQTRMATLPAMPQRNLSQLRTQIEDRISKDD